MAISSLTASNLAGFIDLNFQVPMQYCCLQNQTLLPSPVPSTTGCCFCFGSIFFFLLELYLHSSQVLYWAPTNLGSSSFSVISFFFFSFSYCLWGSRGKNTEGVFIIPFSSGQLFVRRLHMTSPSWVSLHGMAQSFIELDKAVVHVISFISVL